MRVMDGYYRAACKYLLKYSTLAWSKCFRSLILAKSLGCDFKTLTDIDLGFDFLMLRKVLICI